MLRKSVGWRVYLESGAIRMAFFGFSSGLPLLLVLGTLGFWLREAGVDLKTIIGWGSGGHGSLLRSLG